MGGSGVRNSKGGAQEMSPRLRKGAKENWAARKKHTEEKKVPKIRTISARERAG